MKWWDDVRKKISRRIDRRIAHAMVQPIRSDGTLECGLPIVNLLGGTREKVCEHREEIGDLRKRLQRIETDYEDCRKAKQEREFVQALIYDGWTFDRSGLHIGSGGLRAAAFPHDPDAVVQEWSWEVKKGEHVLERSRTTYKDWFKLRRDVRECLDRLSPLMKETTT